MTGMAWSPDGKWLACAGGRVDIWDAQQKKWRILGYTWAKSRPLDDQINCFAWSPDSKQIVCGANHFHLALWDVADRSAQWLMSRAGRDRSAMFDTRGLLLHGEIASVDDDFVYVVQNSDKKFDILTPTEFHLQVFGK